MKHEAKHNTKHEACLRILVSTGIVSVAFSSICLVIYIIDYFRIRDVLYAGLTFRVGIIRSSLGITAGMLCFLTSLIIERKLQKKAAAEQSDKLSEEAADTPEE